MNKLSIIIIVWLLSSTLQGMGKLSLGRRLGQEAMDTRLAYRLDQEVIDTKFPLHAAIRDDNAIELNVLLQKSEVRAVIDAPHSRLDGFPTALHEACQYGTADMVARLLHCGANTEVRTVPEGATPLNLLMNHLYITYEDESIVVLLLDNGADVNARDTEGNTPLHGACRIGSIPMVRLLLQRGARQQCNNLHRLPGTYAANNVEIQKLLMCKIKRSTSIRIPSPRKIEKPLYDDFL